MASRAQRCRSKQSGTVPESAQGEDRSRSDPLAEILDPESAKLLRIFAQQKHYQKAMEEAWEARTQWGAVRQAQGELRLRTEPLPEIPIPQEAADLLAQAMESALQKAPRVKIGNTLAFQEQDLKEFLLAQGWSEDATAEVVVRWSTTRFCRPLSEHCVQTGKELLYEIKSLFGEWESERSSWSGLPKLPEKIEEWPREEYEWLEEKGLERSEYEDRRFFQLHSFTSFLRRLDTLKAKARLVRLEFDELAESSRRELSADVPNPSASAEDTTIRPDRQSGQSTRIEDIVRHWMKTPKDFKDDLKVTKLFEELAKAEVPLSKTRVPLATDVTSWTELKKGTKSYRLRIQTLTRALYVRR